MAQACEDYLTDDGLYFGTDVGESGITFCQKRFTRPNFRFVVNPPTSLPIHGQEFDAACLFSVFTHTYPDETVLLLGEIARLLSATGWVLADVFVRPSVDRYEGNRGMMVLNREQFLRLAKLAGFVGAKVVTTFDWEQNATRLFFKLTRT